MDNELLVILAPILLALLGVLCGILAGYYYFRFERPSETPSVPVAIAALVFQLVLVFALPAVRHDALLPAVFVFSIATASVVMICLGLQVRSRAGIRVALAGMFTMGAYLLKMTTDYYEFHGIRFPW